MSRFDLFNKAQSNFIALDARRSPAFSPALLRIREVRSTVEPVQNPGNWPLIPWPRGPLSDAVIAALSRAPGTLGKLPEINVSDALTDDDLHLALYLCYEVHYRDLTPHDWEWDTDLLRFRAQLEDAFTARLLDEVASHHSRSPFDVTTALDQLLEAAPPSSVSTHFDSGGTLDQMREFCVHKSASHLREGDPQAFAIPRLSGDAKAALIEIQYDDVGSDIARRTHASMFATTLECLGLDPSYGSYVEMLPGTTLAGVNLVSMFALHRKWRAALVGQVAIYEMTSNEPMERYALALDRFGIAPGGRRYFDTHATVDMHHVNGARARLVSGLMAAEPELGPQILFGAAAMLLLEEIFTRHVLDSWERGRSSLAPWEMRTNS
ncbi:MAG: iron-containing redox enzyme family protein [Acidimicrobiaceae bacterium]|nr:iron-containing redox enzyme family protein [Acidimicrobiaceae bacterium]